MGDMWILKDYLNAILLKDDGEIQHLYINLEPIYLNVDWLKKSSKQWIGSYRNQLCILKDFIIEFY